MQNLQRILDALHAALVIQPEEALAERVSPKRGARALAAADHVVVTAIYEPAGREDETLAVSGADLAERIERRPVAYLPAFDDVLSYLDERLAAGTLLLVMGAGDVDRLGHAVARSLSGRS